MENHRYSLKNLPKPSKARFELDQRITKSVKGIQNKMNIFCF